MRILSATTPSGTLHIGHLIGAINQWRKLQDDNEALFCVADMHAITVPQDPEKLRAKIFELAAMYLACGIDPKKSIIFQQSHVSEHAELQWILNTLTPLGELERMTQFKEKKQKSTFAGLLNYPTLMAADILLYQADEVPVGEDQVQHIEFTRMIGEKFNNRFGSTFKLPKAKLAKEGARLMNLQDPSKKMSKSDLDPDSYIALLDDRDTIMKKLRKAVTDSGKEIIFDKEKKPAISNLMTIYAAFTEKSYSAIEKEFRGRSYSDLKNGLAAVLSHTLMPIQERFAALSKHPADVKAVLEDGNERAHVIAQKTLKEVYSKIGFVL